MPDIPEDRLDTIAAERARIFTGRWFADLLGGRLGFGDTFWLGNFGIWLFVVPGVTLLAGLLYAEAPGLFRPFLLVACLVLALWEAALFRALLLVRGQRGARGGWVVTGLVVTFAMMTGAVFYALFGLSAG